MSNSKGKKKEKKSIRITSMILFVQRQLVSYIVESRYVKIDLLKI